MAAVLGSRLAEEEVMPMLLFSRRRLPVASEVDKKPRRRLAPASLEIPEDTTAKLYVIGTDSLESGAEVDACGLAEVRVKNTFIDGAVPPSPSMEPFFRERAVQTCPSRHSGRIAAFLESVDDLAAEAGEEAFATAAAAAMLVSAATPCGIETPIACHMYHSTVWAMLASAAPFHPSGSYQAVVQKDSKELPQSSLPTVLCLEAALATEAYPDCYPKFHPEVYYEVPQMWAPQMPSCDMAAIGMCTAVSFEPLGYLPPSQPQPVMLCTLPPAPPASTAASMAASTAPPSFSPPVSAPTEAAPEQVEAGDVPPPPPAAPALGSEELPSSGSAEHAAGTCRPCAFLHAKGCNNGIACRFCHLCGPDERRRRQKEKIHLLKEQRRQPKGSEAEV